jgi:hypothetical protein
MTQPQNPSAFMDVGNPLLQPTPVRLDAGSVTLADGTVLGMVTFRSSSTTFHSFLSPEEVQQWADTLADIAKQLGAGRNKLAVAGPQDAALLTQSLKGHRG